MHYIAVLKVLEDFFDARQEYSVHDCPDSDNYIDEPDVNITDFGASTYQSQQSHEALSNSISPHSSQPSLAPCVITELESLKSKLKVTRYKNFQVAAIEALQGGKDVIVVQPTGSGKSLCYVESALMNPGKITLVIDPLIAVITNQIQNLKLKEIDAFALGGAAGKKQPNEFSQSVKEPM